MEYKFNAIHPTIEIVSFLAGFCKSGSNNRRFKSDKPKQISLWFKSREPNPAGSEPAYVGLMERICTFIEPSLITFGSLRATPLTWRFLPDQIRAQLTEHTPWGHGYPLTTRLSFYSELIDVARRYGMPVALCKEPLDVWRSLKLRSKCNCMP